MATDVESSTANQSALISWSRVSASRTSMGPKSQRDSDLDLGKNYEKRRASVSDGLEVERI